MKKPKCQTCEGWGGLMLTMDKWATCPKCAGSGTTKNDNPKAGMGLTFAEMKRGRLL